MQEDPSCRVCLSAAAGGRASKNCRLNVSAVIRYSTDQDHTLKNVLIDCGKTFYTAARRWAVPLRIGAFEGVLLTHGHADAMLGLDDLRHWTGHGAIQDMVRIWADASTMDVVARAFPYLVDPGKATGGGFVSDLQFNIIPGPLAPFQISGLEIEPLYVEHGLGEGGSPYMCLAFLFDRGRLAYLSDVSRIPEETMLRLQAVQPEVLVLDCLREERPYRSHFILNESLEAVRAIRPKGSVYFVGMTHDIDHDEFNAKLQPHARELGCSIQLAYDGLTIPLSS